MAAETTVARESRVNPVNAINRTKSIDDLVGQANRIAEAGNNSRTRRSEEVLRRYRRNIQNARGDSFWQGNIFEETSRKYTRRQYMGR